MPASFINDPDHWRNRAEEARTLPDEMNDEGSRQTMLRIVEEYARRAEERAKHSPR